jgi:hypothetical protein
MRIGRLSSSFEEAPPSAKENDSTPLAVLQAVSSRDDFLFSGKEEELFMQGMYSHGTGPE